MPGLPPARSVRLALRCYPRRWRRRHGAEAAELAGLLIRDGVPARSIACSYLCAAARERLTPQPGHRLAAAAAALLIAAASLSVPLGLLSASASASAASATRTHPSGPSLRPRCADLGSQARPPAPARLRQPPPASLWARPASLSPADGHGQHC
jgi:hypothetical protein